MHTVIYHSADLDGVFCREIARKALGETATYIGWNYGDPQIPVPPEGHVFLLDLNPECLCDSPGLDSRIWDRIVWIDHHKSAIEKWPVGVKGCRIDGVGACRIAWQWFFDNLPPYRPIMIPPKPDFIQRLVIEPFAVTLAGEYDVWDHRGDGDLELQYGLRCVDQINWNALLSTGYRHECDILVDRGRVAMAYAKHVDASLVKSKSFLTNWEGLNFLCLNTGRFNSNTFAAKDVPETGHDALLGFNWDGKKWTVCLYHAAHRKDLDLSLIAVKHGGGGHKGACGFNCDKLPFLL